MKTRFPADDWRKVQFEEIADWQAQALKWAEEDYIKARDKIFDESARRASEVSKIYEDMKAGRPINWEALDGRKPKN